MKDKLKQNGDVIGRTVYDNGDVWEGEWKEDGDCIDLFCGKVTYANGDFFEGKWEEGTFSGYGKLTYPNGDVYEGEWKDGLQHGQGKMTYANGKVYEGEWKHGSRKDAPTLPKDKTSKELDER